MDLVKLKKCQVIRVNFSMTAQSAIKLLDPNKEIVASFAHTEQFHVPQFKIIVLVVEFGR